MQKRQLIIIICVIIILGGSMGLYIFFASLKEAPEVRKPLVTKKYVKTAPVIYSDINTYINAYGRVQTAQSLDLISEVAGRMFEGQIRLKEGENFKKGTLLFYIDDKEASLTLKSQKSNFLRDLALILPDLKIDYSDNYESWQNYFGRIDLNKSLPELPNLKSDKEKTFLATKGIYATFYTIKSAEERLSKYRFYAPFDGSLSEVNIETGSFLNPGVSIGTIIRMGIHELQVAVETKDIPWVQLGTIVEIYSEETQQKWAGEILRINDVIDPNTQSVNVFLSIKPGQQKIYDGQFIQASIPARQVKDGMIIPRNSLYNTNEVFVVEDTLLKVKQVLVHRTMKEDVIISGLEDNEQVVIEPLINAHNNMVVFKQEQKDIELEATNSTVSGESGYK